MCFTTLGPTGLQGRACRGWGQRQTASHRLRPAKSRSAEGAVGCLDRHAILLHETLVFSFRLQAVPRVELGSTGGSAWNLAVPVLCSGAESSRGISQVRQKPSWSGPCVRCDAGKSPGRQCVEIRVLQKHVQYQLWLSRGWRDGHGVPRRPFGRRCGSTGFVSSLANIGGEVNHLAWPEVALLLSAVFPRNRPDLR